jgi:hypothetical protein
LVAILAEVSNPQIEQVKNQLSWMILRNNNQLDVIGRPSTGRSRSRNSLLRFSQALSQTVD